MKEVKEARRRRTKVNYWKGGVEELGVSLWLLTIECGCDRLGDVTRFIKVADRHIAK